MAEVQLEENDRIDWVLKVFKRRVQSEGILQEVRRRRHYVKPSAARLAKSKAAQRARHKAARRQWR